MKTCSHSECPAGGTPQNLSEFGNNKSTPDGKNWYCKACAARVQREWKASHKEKVSAWNKRRYQQRRDEEAIT
jgi:hypothetical protein